MPQGKVHTSDDLREAPGATVATHAKFRYIHSPDFADLLAQLNISLAISTYQASKVMLVRARQGGGLSILLRHYEQPMGLAVDTQRMAIGTRRQIWFLRNDNSEQLEPPNTLDTYYTPRASHVTSDIRSHEIAWIGDDLWVVNTRFSCLCTLSDDDSFVPRWWPPFITDLTSEDRCHLNGLAVADGKVKFVSAHGVSNEHEGWRPTKSNGGVIIDVESGQVVSTGLSMGHSPRVYAGRLWMLDSGKGELQTVDLNDGKRTTVLRLPGFTRGLAFYDRYAFVGLSKVRQKDVFGDLPLEQWAKENRCGVHAVDLDTGQSAGFLEFEKGCAELFDVQVLADIRWPALSGFHKPMPKR